MDLNHAELRDLATFFEKRFPTLDQKQRLCAAARMKRPTAGMTWGVILEEAHARGRLPALARAASQLDPSDHNLASMSAVLYDGRRRPCPTALAVGAAAVLFVAIGTAVGLGTSEPTAHAAPVPPPAPEASAPATALVSSAGLSAPPSEPSLTPAASKGGTPLPAGVPEPEATAPPAPVAPTVAQNEAPANANGRCTVRGGGLVGYWYAGRTSPGAQGATITMPNAVRVRAHYPGVHNDFDTRTPIRCFLSEGDRVRLSQAPIAVPGNAFWVPLHSGDLIRD